MSFPHHNYQYPVDQGDHEFVASEQARGIEDPTCSDVPEAAAALRNADVGKVLLVHGTFAGDDILGLMRELGRILPGTAQALRSFGKSLVDQVAGDIGNYTKQFAERLSHLVNDDHETKIEVGRFLWSGENHHVGRASGAIRLLDELLKQDWSPDKRMLLIAHSHGGNLVALLLNLVHCEHDLVERFFEATKPHYREAVTGRVLLPAWERVREQLLKGDALSRLPTFDVATFGTPPRYRWTMQSPHLVHFVQHRPQYGDRPTKARMPKSIGDLTQAKGGDYIQQLGIGGTDFFHAVTAWGSWRTERRLRRLLENNVRRRDLPRNLLRGHRVSLDGKTLLVDYPPEPANWNQAILGHAIYTRQEWLPFHLKEIVARFYSTG